jgi:hypothetical protein
MIQDRILVLDKDNNIVVDTPSRNNFIRSNNSECLDNKRIVKEGVKEADISWAFNKTVNCQKK